MSWNDDKKKELTELWAGVGANGNTAHYEVLRKYSQEQILACIVLGQLEDGTYINPALKA